jgi:hypothetical protein
VAADYEMDPEIVNHPAYRDELVPALKSIPTMSVVMAPADLFDAQRGLYANPKESGADWERPASVELIFPDGRKGFQVNCGIRIQGGWNRRPEESPKHSFRLVFKKKSAPNKCAEASPNAQGFILPVTHPASIAQSIQAIGILAGERSGFA